MRFRHLLYAALVLAVALTSSVMAQEEEIRFDSPESEARYVFEQFFSLLKQQNFDELLQMLAGDAYDELSSGLAEEGFQEEMTDLVSTLEYEVHSVAVNPAYPRHAFIRYTVTYGPEAYQETSIMRLVRVNGSFVVADLDHHIEDDEAVGEEELQYYFERLQKPVPLTDKRELKGEEQALFEAMTRVVELISEGDIETLIPLTTGQARMELEQMRQEEEMLMEFSRRFAFLEGVITEISIQPEASPMQATVFISLSNIISHPEWEEEESSFIREGDTWLLTEFR